MFRFMNSEYEWKKYGAFCIRFYDNGEETIVIVDDYLPIKHDIPIFGRSTNKHEFWISIIEKAYAKKYGSYSIIEGGHTHLALAELTNGLPKNLRNKEKKKNLEKYWQ